MKRKTPTPKPKLKIRICEVFNSIQGEGYFSGVPMLFIRTSGCNRACSFCDTKYHTKGKDKTIKRLVEKINIYRPRVVCWTGGEPLLYRDQICEVAKKTLFTQHHLETNGDFLEEKDFFIFDYITCSPKDLRTAKRVFEFRDRHPGQFEIKVVSDFKKVGVKLLPYATSIMPLTTYDPVADLAIIRKAWDEVIIRSWKAKRQILFSPRLQYFVWGAKKGV